MRVINSRGEDLRASFATFIIFTLTPFISLFLWELLQYCNFSWRRTLALLVGQGGMAAAREHVLLVVPDPVRLPCLYDHRIVSHTIAIKCWSLMLGMFYDRVFIYKITCIYIYHPPIMRYKVYWLIWSVRVRYGLLYRSGKLWGYCNWNI